MAGICMRDSAQLSPRFPDDGAGILDIPSCMMLRSGIFATVLLVGAVSACSRISSAPAPVARVWRIGSPLLFDPSTPGDSAAGSVIVLDSAAFRPVLFRRGTGISTFTNYQGARYHPEAVRAVAEEPAVLDTFSRTAAVIASTVGSGLLLDFQEMSATDIPQFVELVRALGAAARARSLTPFGIMIPAGDTLAYPAPILARVADVIVVRLGIEHRPGTPPGPLTTPDFIRRQLGARAIGLGATRLAAEFPLYGYIWSRDGKARVITYREANDLILREAGAFRRDPASQFLTADGRDGWTIWVPDLRTIRSLIEAARSRGVNSIALSGWDGSDPALAGLFVKR